MLQQTLLILNPKVQVIPFTNYTTSVSKVNFIKDIFGNIIAFNPRFLINFFSVPLR